MKDPETGLTDRTLKTIRLYIANFLERNNNDYTFAQAMRDAGYTQRYTKSFCSKIWSNIVVQDIVTKRIAELEQKTDLTVQKVLENLSYGVNLAKQKGNLVALARFLELQGKTLAMYTDNVNQTDTQKQRELDEKEGLEAKRLAELANRDRIRILNAVQGQREAEAG